MPLFSLNSFSWFVADFSLILLDEEKAYEKGSGDWILWDRTCFWNNKARWFCRAGKQSFNDVDNSFKQVLLKLEGSIHITVLAGKKGSGKSSLLN